jgi:hypothetical protein
MSSFAIDLTIAMVVANCIYGTIQFTFLFLVALFAQYLKIKQNKAQLDSVMDLIKKGKAH